MEPLNKNILLAGEVIAERWKVVEKIGEGTFSQIYLALALHTNQRVAVKVEAPSALKPVLEWEASILKSLQDCDHVCRYYYHGKHADSSTVLVMELLGESMSMLRVSPDAIHGVPLARCVSVGLEMLDCIEAFHQHGFVHRDIKASNFAMSDVSNPAKRKYFIIDFGLSRQHIGDDHTIIPPRPVAEFRGTSMYASLSSHRRCELGPKDDLWSWFYLVMDFMRGELPWAIDAQRKNRETVLTLKEYYTDKAPSLLVEGLAGATHLVAIMTYLTSLSYSDTPDYLYVRQLLQRVETSSKEDDTMALWVAIRSDRERALQWAMRATDALAKNAPLPVLETLWTVARRFGTFFGITDFARDERMDVQAAVFAVETQLEATQATHALAPPPIQSFVKRRLSEQKGRSDAMRRRRERDVQIRQMLEQKTRRAAVAAAATAAGTTGDASSTPQLHPQSRLQESVRAHVVKSDDSAMDMSDGDEETLTPPPPTVASVVATALATANASNGVDSVAIEHEVDVLLTSLQPQLPQQQQQQPLPLRMQHLQPPQQQRWHVPPPQTRPPPPVYSASPQLLMPQQSLQPQPPLPPGTLHGGGYSSQHQQHQSLLPRGAMYPLPAAKPAFVPPLPPMPPVYNVPSPSANGNETANRPTLVDATAAAVTTQPRDRSSNHAHVPTDAMHHRRRSHAYEYERRTHRSASSSRSPRSTSRSRSQSPSRARKRSHSYSRSHRRRRSRSWSRSPSRSFSRSPPPASSRRRHSRSFHRSRSRSSERHHHHHHHHHHYIASASTSSRVRGGTSKYGSSVDARRSRSRSRERHPGDRSRR